ncbi:SAF domain-containing protein [Cohnella sp. GCM10020058]|uniref:SAF domain-containing protein n=1 Tax=Cohnella sp. GCM10020058 TaxID=3317330 RepID=UPI003631BAFA
MKKSMIWVGALAAVGLAIGLVIFYIINSYLDLGTVYVAKAEIPVQTEVKVDLFKSEKQPKKNIPADAITSEKELDELKGRVTRGLIVKDQVLQKSQVSEAHNLREVVQSFSPAYVAVTVPIEQNDIPITEISRNDVISLIGVRKETSEEGGERIVKEYVAEKVLVLDAIVDKSSSSGKVMVLMPRVEAPGLKEYIATGKVYIALDPRKFELKGE